MEAFAVTWDDVRAAAARLRGVAVETPLLPLPDADGVHLKLENLQRTGSFKLRGALNAVALLPADTAAHGLTTASAGNHGLAVAWAGRRRSLPVRVHVPPGAVLRKVEAIRAAGAEVLETPLDRLGDILARGDAGDGRAFVPPFAHPHVVAGQGTVGAEIARQFPDARSVLVPVGGGGLALGVAVALASACPRAKVWGVGARAAPAVARAWATGRSDPVRPTSIADGLGAPRADLRVVAGLRERLAGLLEVDDDSLRAAMRRLAASAKVVAEPAGAAAVAAALEHAELPRPVVAVVSGGNVDPALLSEVLR